MELGINSVFAPLSKQNRIAFSLMKRLILFILIGLYFFCAKSQVLPAKSEIIKKMKLVDDYWIATHEDPGHRGWDRAVYFTGNMDFYKTYQHHKFLEYSELWAENHNWSIDAGVNSTNADQQCAGQVYIEHFLMDEVKDSSKIAVIRGSLQNMINRKNSTAWWWIDALYMAMPSFARLGVILNDTSYFEQMYRLYTNTKVERGLYNTTEGLWYRDESFDPPYFTPNGEDSYWARGNGWVFGAHVRVLQVLPKNDPHRAEYVQTFKEMAAALLARQRTDGFWNVSLDDPNDYGGPETSGTSFFTYGMAWGISNGFLEYETYYPAVAKAWNALTAEAVHDDGFLGYVQGVGVGPSSSQPVTYESTTDFGVGAFLLAGTEVIKLAGGTIPAPPTFWVNGVELDENNQLKISFNQPLNTASAKSLEHYTLDESIQIDQISLSENQEVVTLHFSGLQRGKYSVSIQNIESETGEVLEDTARYTFVFHDLEIVDFSGYEANSTNFPDNTLDLDFSTRWSASGDGQFITYDLGALKQVGSVQIAFYQGNTRRAFFSVQTSTDGVNFQDALVRVTSSGISSNLEIFDFPDVLARYVKIIGHGNSASVWNSWTEVFVDYSAVVTDGNGKLDFLEITPGQLEPSFSPDQLEYSISLPFGTTEIQIAATPQNSAATVDGSGLIVVDENTESVMVKVTSSNGEIVQNYVISLEFVKSTISTLSGIFLNGKLIADFSSEVTEYVIYYPQAGISVPTLTANLTDSRAKIVSITNASAIPGQAEILVEAENGDQRTYTLYFKINPESDSYLTDILVDGASFPGFAYTKFAYDYEIPVGSEVMPVFDFVKSNEAASVVVYPLLEIPGNVHFLVTAADGVSQNVYKINVDYATVLGIDGQEALIFPNPFSDQLTISTNSELADLKLFTMAGQQIPLETSTLTDGNHLILPVLLQKGIYLLEITYLSGQKKSFPVIRN